MFKIKVENSINVTCKDVKLLLEKNDTIGILENTVLNDDINIGNKVDYSGRSYEIIDINDGIVRIKDINTGEEKTVVKRAFTESLKKL